MSTTKSWGPARKIGADHFTRRNLHCGFTLFGPAARPERYWKRADPYASGAASYDVFTLPTLRACRERVQRFNATP